MNSKQQNRGLSSALRRVLADFGGVYFVSGLVAFIFAASGPVAIILAVGTRGGLNALRPVLVDFRRVFRERPHQHRFLLVLPPAARLFLDHPGAVLVGPALGHLSYAEVIGAYVATGILMLALGLSGWVRRAMEAVRCRS